MRGFLYNSTRKYLFVRRKSDNFAACYTIWTEEKQRIKTKNIIMRKDIHPSNYRPVVFKDMSNGDMFLTRSTCKSNETIEFEGQEYPLIKVEISSTSHPFYTGKNKLVDTAGRVDKFLSRYGKSRKQ